MDNLSIINSNLLTKEGIKETAIAIKTALDEGNVNPLDLKMAFKAIEKLGEQIKEKLAEHSLEEADKYGKSFKFKGANFTVMEAGTKYDYSDCNHAEYNDLVSQIAELNKRKKDIEEELKTIKGSRTIVNEETGEIITLYPPKKTSTTTLTVSL